MSLFEQSRTTTTTSQTSHSVLLPNNSNVSGKRILLIACVEDGAGTQLDFTWPSGFTEIDQLNGGTSALRAGVAYRIVDGTEGWGATDQTVTVGTSGTEDGAFIVARLSADADVANRTFERNAAAGTTTVSFPTETKASAASYLWVGAAVWRYPRSTTGYPPSNYSSMGTGNSGDSSAAGIYRVATLAEETPGSFTLSSNTAYRTWTIAIPDTSAADPTPTGRDVTIDLANKTVTVVQGR